MHLPKPDPDSAAHGARVVSFLRDRIASAGGSIGFDEFMQHALHAPGLGYYAAGSAKFGAAGDFVTAPEVSSLFGRVVARQCADLLAQLPGAGILEPGAGTGRLAADVLTALDRIGRPPARYLILEPSAELAARQREYLAREAAELARRVAWIDDWPRDFRGVVLANEVLDALPVARFMIRGTQVRELRVGLADGGFAWQDAPAGPLLEAAVRGIESQLGAPLPEHYVSEVCLALPHWISGLAGCLADGLALLFDYGVSRREYYAAGKNGGWLRCHFRHRVHDDPLILAGIQDLSAWVDFTAVAGAAIDHGLDVAGYASQAGFLMHGGLENALAEAGAGLSAEHLELSRQVKLLTLPGEMGENFKCMGLRKGSARAPAVLVACDRAHTL
ncbi:MAG: class I SAM-dependent methyltransferase [Woeseiaceae bacterium]